MNKTCIILCAFHTYFPFILSALSSQNPVQIFQNYINIDWLCNMSIPSCLDCFFTILLIGKCHGEHLGLCDFLHGMQFSVLQRPQDTQGIVCLAGDEQGTAPSGARLQDYHSKADKISRVYFPAFVTFFCCSPQTCVPNLIRPQQGAWT